MQSPCYCLDSENGVLLGSRRCIRSCFSEPSFPSELSLSQRVGWIEDLPCPWTSSFPHPVSACARPQRGCRMRPVPGECTDPSAVCSSGAMAGDAAVSAGHCRLVPTCLSLPGDAASVFGVHGFSTWAGPASGRRAPFCLSLRLRTWPLQKAPAEAPLWTCGVRGPGVELHFLSCRVILSTARLRTSILGLDKGVYVRDQIGPIRDILPHTKK